MKPNIELIKNLVIGSPDIVVYNKKKSLPIDACKNWRSKIDNNLVFFGVFSMSENVIKPLGITEAIWMKDSRI